MAKLRFLGALSETVPVLGRAVVPDELVEVDDDLYAEVLWPEALWQPVAEPKSAIKPKSEQE